MSANAALLELKDEAASRFAGAGVPHRRIEAWHYTDLRAAVNADLPPAGDYAGAGVPAGEVAGVTTVHAPGVGDDEVVAQCRDHTASGDAVTVASAYRGLLSRLDPLGVTTLGPRALRAEVSSQR